MRMGFKYQLLSCSSADELLQVTVNHLRNTRELIDADDVKRLIDDTTVLCTQVDWPSLDRVIRHLTQR